MSGEEANQITELSAAAEAGDLAAVTWITTRDSLS